MRSPFSLFCGVLILVVSCATDPAREPNGSAGAVGAGVEEPPAPVPDVHQQRIRVEWRTLNPRREDPPIGLINRSSPDLVQLTRDPQAFPNVKPVDDDIMGALLEAFREEDYFEHAERGRTLDSLRPGEGHGAIYLGKNDEHWVLVFRPGQTDTRIPEIYVTLKNWLIAVHRRTLWFTPTTTRDADRIFRVDPHKHSGR